MDFEGVLGGDGRGVEGGVACGDCAEMDCVVGEFVGEEGRNGGKMGGAGGEGAFVG